MTTKRTSRSKTARSGGGKASSRAASRSGGKKGAGEQPATAPPIPGTAGSLAPQNIPALSKEAQEQAERDRTGKTRPGFVRRDLPPAGANYGGVFYGGGEKREIPQGLSDHLDTIGINPDASTELNRKTRFGGGKEDDQDAQGKAFKSVREGAVSARRKHRARPEFEAIAGASKKKSSSK